MTWAHAVRSSLTHDSVLRMADTEAPTTQDTESSCDKLYTLTSPSGLVVTGGAGDGHLSDCAKQALQAVLRSRYVWNNPMFQ